MTEDAWRISRKVNGLQMCLASSRVDGYVHFVFSSGDKMTDFTLDEARMMHSALGAILPDMNNTANTAPPKDTVSKEKVAPKKLETPKAQSTHAGARWTDEEDVRLVSSLKAGKSIDEMSKEHSRSPSAIMSRLHKNDLIKITVK